MDIKDIILRIEKFFGSLKFAVFIISIFVVFLIYGTFMESYHGTEYANRLIYKSTPFMFIQALMFLSIFTATLLRLPPKKMLYGFYTIHLGLLLLFAGSFITFYAGVDGNLTLPPNTPQSEIMLPDDILKIQISENEVDVKEIIFPLPFWSGENVLDQTYEYITLKNFLPFADNKLHWTSFSKTDSDVQHGSVYSLFNDNVTEEITFSLHPEAEFETTKQLGPLNIHYLPKSLFSCFDTENVTGLIIWNAVKGSCATPKDKTVKVSKNSDGRISLKIKHLNEVLTFFPELSPLPTNEKKQIIQDSPLRVFSKKLFEKSPHLFLFGNGVAFFDKDSKKWLKHELAPKSQVELPWMGLQIKLEEHYEDHFPQYIPKYVVPVHDNGKIIFGNTKALKVSVRGEEYWITEDKPLGLMIEGKKHIFELAKKTIKLPYEMNLQRFKMDKDPGTNSPASYESFVGIFDKEGRKGPYHVFMNNPYKRDGFTFYQASYFETKSGYGSVLSVNYDPGRPVKYFGSILLVLGCIWHFLLRRKKGTKFFSSSLSQSRVVDPNLGEQNA